MYYGQHLYYGGYLLSHLRSTGPFFSLLRKRVALRAISFAYSLRPNCIEPALEVVEGEPAVEGFTPGSAGVAGIVGTEGACAVVVEVHFGVCSGAFPVEV